MIYGYTRVSTQQQSIERQIRNIKAVYPDVIIYKEIYTGTKFQGRKELEKLLKRIKAGDTIVFDSVSRMSRNADEGYELYEKLFYDDITLVFLKEPLINTETYKKALTKQISFTGDKVDYILEGVNRYLMELAKEQIRIVFEQAEKEVLDLRQRTREGMETARLTGKQIGQKKGAKLHVKKAEKAKAEILKYNKAFGGVLNNKDTWTLIGIDKNTFYKYKKELLKEGINE